MEIFHQPGIKLIGFLSILYFQNGGNFSARYRLLVFLTCFEGFVHKIQEMFKRLSLFDFIQSNEFMVAIPIDIHEGEGVIYKVVAGGYLYYFID